MTKLLTRVRKKFKSISKASKSDSETIIRRRIFIEELRSDLYYKYYLFNQIETVILRIIAISIVVFNITNFFMHLYSNLALPCLLILVIIGFKIHFGMKNKQIRLAREVHKIKKVLDHVDLDQELPTKLVEWYYVSKDFLTTVG